MTSPHDNDRSQAFCRAVVKVMPAAHSIPPPSHVISPIYNDKLSPETATLVEPSTADNKLPTICAHFSIYFNWPVGWTCSKILAVPSQPDRDNGNAMRKDIIVIEALLFQLHPADVLKKHA
ncbi:hypothetical protein T11_1276 [Trichinella zimbabwensis]|uniref:Uncharacterized protein n=1 Tax=Trichinella zimbabwensis TaxID=268475 RepID=A0A0V1HCX6_9BILA|nr:hypothetical protein T11_1276 [Trichinella zimbabwensis]